MSFIERLLRGRNFAAKLQRAPKYILTDSYVGYRFLGEETKE